MQLIAQFYSLKWLEKLAAVPLILWHALAESVIYLLLCSRLWIQFSNWLFLIYVYKKDILWWHAQDCIMGESLLSFELQQEPLLNVSCLLLWLRDLRSPGPSLWSSHSKRMMPMRKRHGGSKGSILGLLLINKELFGNFLIWNDISFCNLRQIQAKWKKAITKE